jgi:hypothetical protein
MNVFLSIGPINLDLSSLISFLIGISFGFLMLLLIYVYAVLKSINKGLKLRQTDEQDIDEEEIKWLIQDAIKLFKNKEAREEAGFAKHLLDINKELSVDIAKKFYPKSKYPYLELTVDETLMLNHYITDRFQELMASSRILRLTRGWTLAKIVEMNEVKNKIEQNAIVKTVKKYSGLTKAAGAVMNAVNPVYWFRRFTKEVALQIVSIQIGVALIKITGEETYKIYSKKVFDVEKSIDMNVEELYNDLKKEVKSVVEQGDE